MQCAVPVAATAPHTTYNVQKIGALYRKTGLRLSDLISDQASYAVAEKGGKGSMDINSHHQDVDTEEANTMR